MNKSILFNRLKVGSISFLMAFGFVISSPQLSEAADVVETDLSTPQVNPIENDSWAQNQEAPSTKAKEDFSTGFKGIGGGIKNGTKATGHAFKKVGTTVGKGFKKAGSTVKNFFVRNKSTDGVEEQDLMAVQTYQAEENAAYETQDDLDAVGNDARDDDIELDLGTEES